MMDSMSSSAEQATIALICAWQEPNGTRQHRWSVESDVIDLVRVLARLIANLRRVRMPIGVLTGEHESRLGQAAASHSTAESLISEPAVRSVGLL